MQEYECNVGKKNVKHNIWTWCNKAFVLCFQIDFEEDGNLFESDNDVTISIEDDVKAEKQKSAADFTPADDDHLSGDDKTEVCMDFCGVTNSV